MQVVERKSWRVSLIAILARWSVKLKLIAWNPTRWAEMSIARGENVMRRISNDQKNENRITLEFPPISREAERKLVYFPDDRDPDYYYYSWKFRVREYLDSLVRQVLNNLMAGNSRSKRPAAFEVRTLIYRSALDNSLRHLTVQRDGTIETSSDHAGLRHSYRALQLLLSNVQTIAKKDRVPASSDVAKFHWQIKLAKGSADDGGAVATDRLDDVISALVPLTLIGSSAHVKKLNASLLREHSDEDPQPLSTCPSTTLCELSFP